MALASGDWFLLQRGSTSYKCAASNLFKGNHNNASLLINSGSISYRLQVGEFLDKKDFSSNEWVLVNRGSTSYKMKATNVQYQMMALMPNGWTQTQVTPDSYLYDVAYGRTDQTDSYGARKHRYVVTAKGDATGTNFYHSEDLVTWTAAPFQNLSGNAIRWSTIAYGGNFPWYYNGGIFIAFGTTSLVDDPVGGERVYVGWSPDGHTWYDVREFLPYSAAYIPRKLVYGNGVFVLLMNRYGTNSTPKLFYLNGNAAKAELNGTWTECGGSAMKTSNDNWSDVDYRDGKWITTSTTNNGFSCATSTDGRSWIPGTYDPSNTFNGKGKNCAAGASGCISGIGSSSSGFLALSGNNADLVLSATGQGWTEVDNKLKTGVDFLSCCWGGDKWMAVRNSTGASQERIWYSTNGTNWTGGINDFDVRNSYRTIKYLGGKFVAVASKSSGSIQGNQALAWSYTGVVNNVITSN